MASVPIGGAGPPIDAGMPAPMNPVVTQETVNMNSSDGQATDVRKKVLYDEKGTYKTFKVIAQSLKNSKARFLSLHLLGKKLKEVTNEAIQVVNKERLSRDKVLIICANAQSANALVLSEVLTLEYDVFIPMNFISRSAIIRDIDLELTEEELFQNIETRQFKLLSVQRLKRKSFDPENKKAVYVPARTLKLTFDGQDIPAYVYLWYSRITVEPYVQSVMQCFKCLKFGHTNKFCKSPKSMCRKCFKPQDDEHQCDFQNIKCSNCDGLHNPNSQNCPELDRQKNIKFLMSTRNLCFQEASVIYPPIKTPTFAVKTHNRFAALEENVDAEFPPLNPGKDNRDEPLEVYVPPPLPYKPAVVNNTNKNSRNVRSNKRRDSSHFELPKDSTSTKKLRNSEEKIKDNHVAEMFYKRCAERKMENQALARQAEADVDWVISSLNGEVGANQVQVHPYAVSQSPMSDESFDDLFYPNQDTRAMNIQLNDQNLGQGFPDDPMSPDLS